MGASDDLRVAWDQFCEDLKGAVDHVVDPARDVSDDERAEGVRHVLRMLAMQNEQIFENEDPLHPELGWRYPSKMGQDNPDALYQTAPLDLQYSYRLSGNIGSVRSLGISVMTWTFGGDPIRQLLDIDGADLAVDSDGEFSVVLSPDPVPEGTPEGEWFQLEPLPTRLLLRQFFADWETEVPAAMHLECLDADGPPARLTSDGVVDKLQRMAAMTSLMGAYWTGFGEGHEQRGEINRFEVPRDDAETSSLGGTERQAYRQCMWRVGPDEALLIEFTPPPCHYWEAQLGDRWYQSLDFINRQVTLNDAQAEVDADGVVRIVVAAVDPGVANWLDTAGCADGYLTMRFNLPESKPAVELSLLSLTELDDRLPATTSRVSADERAFTQASRRRAALARFRR